MALKEDVQADFATILTDFGISTTFAGTTKTVNAVRNSMDKEIMYEENGIGKSIDYKFTLWYDVSDITALSLTVPEVHSEITVDSTVYLVAKRTYDPLEALVALDMVERYG